MRIHLVIMAAAFSFAAGCASIVSGTTQEVTFQSSPEGATVVADGRTLGVTPVTVLLKKGQYRAVSFEKDGHKKVSLPMNSRLNGWFWGNIVIGGFVGSTTDAVSGAAHEYAPNQFIVTLPPARSGALESEVGKKKGAKAREFIIIANKSIRTDLAKGKGEYLDSLVKALEIPAVEASSAVVRLKALSQAYPDIVDFADKTIDMFARAGEPGPVSPGLRLEDLAGLEPERQYALLFGAERADSERALNAMDASARGKVTDHIMKSKGKRIAPYWDFQLNPGLSYEERDFIDWYLKQFSDYEKSR